MPVEGPTLAELRPQVLARAGYRCQRCGKSEREAWTIECHHRLMRSQGGPNTLANLVALCGPNPAGCHGWVHQHPSAAYAAGLLIRSHQGPPTEPWAPLLALLEEPGLPRPW